MHPVKVSCVSYINSAPFVYGLQHHAVADEIQLSLDNPFECAAKLISGEVAIGLIPVAAMESVPGAQQITNWCIGANGSVKSVTLLSDVPLNKIEKILLDFQSVTSNVLTQILSKHFWNIDPVFEKTQKGFEHNISGTCAGVVIGDRSLLLQHKYNFVYDLSLEWKTFTGLPFVFARWVTNQKLESGFLNRFDAALSSGINQLDKVINDLKTVPGYQDETEMYLKNNLSYNFDSQKREGMNLFLKYAGSFSEHGVRASL